MPLIMDTTQADSNFVDLADHMFAIYSKAQPDDPGMWMKKIFSAATDLFKDKERYNKIPLLNNMGYEDMSEGQTVRFRGMIQDSYDNEMFLGVYHVKNVKSGEVASRSGLFRDRLESQGFEDPLLEHPRNEFMERRVFYVVSVPGEAPWVHTGFAQGETEEARRRSGGELEEERRRPLHTDATDPTSGLRTLFNFPLPHMDKGNSRAAIVKVYDQETKTLVINEIFEFLGVLSLEAFGEEEDRCGEASSGSSGMPVLVDEEAQVRNPPASLVPRLHVIGFQKLEHINPYVPQSAADDGLIDQCEKGRLRRELHSFLRDALLGDEFAAEYVLLSLVSYVFGRNGSLALGKNSTNLLIGERIAYPSQDFIPQLYRVIQEVVTKSYFLPLTLESLSSSTLVPKKDYEKNRLTSGILQLSSNTVLLIDETKLEAGQLSDMGLSNINALSTLLSDQRVEYEFKYHKLEFLADVPAIVLSNQPTILPCDITIPLGPATDPREHEEGRERINSRLVDQEFMRGMRKYLTVVRFQDYNLEEDMQKRVQEDFVSSRNSPEGDNISSEEFLQLLNLCRLRCLSEGRTTLDASTWTQIRKMEQKRKALLEADKDKWGWRI